MDYALEAVKRAGLEPKRAIVRGGTDGSRLSYMGVPTPNLFAGYIDPHGKKEYVVLEWMEKSVETMLNIIDICYELLIVN